MSFADSLFRFLRSLRLTLFLIALMIVCFIWESLLPDTKLLRSPFFLCLIALLFLNLLFCTLYRFIKELNKEKSRNFGPDFLHVAILLLLLGAFLSGLLRVDFTIWLHEGEQVELPGGSILLAEGLETQLYEDGRVKEWTSTVTVTKTGQVLAESVPIRVNHPLKVDGVSLYQSSWGETEKGECSIIQAVYDPSLSIIITALILAGAGIFITLYSRLFSQR